MRCRFNSFSESAVRVKLATLPPVPPATGLVLRRDIRRSQVVHRVSSSVLGPAVPSFRALSGRLTFTFRRHKSDTDSLSS